VQDTQLLTVVVYKVMLKHCGNCYFVMQMTWIESMLEVFLLVVFSFCIYSVDRISMWIFVCNHAKLMQLLKLEVIMQLLMIPYYRLKN
jgi:uncharacterized membrane protein